MYVKSRNLGIKNSRADWIAFIDTDDIWFSEKLEKCHEVINKKDVDLIYHSVNYINKKNFSKIIKEKSKRISVPVEKYLYSNGNIIAQSSVVVKRGNWKKLVLFFRKKKNFMVGRILMRGLD